MVGVGVTDGLLDAVEARETGPSAVRDEDLAVGEVEELVQGAVRAPPLVVRRHAQRRRGHAPELVDEDVDGGVVREVLKHQSVEEVVLCDIDEVRPVHPVRLCMEG